MPNNSQDRLVIFTRFPQPGRTKTRLIPSLGPNGAADLQRQMTESTAATAKKFITEAGIELEIRYDGGDHAEMQRWLGQDLLYCQQGPGDLGEKMERTFDEAFAGGSKRVMIIGSDCPDLSREILATGFNALADHDLVLGPASDGGYYLIGLSAPFPALFRNRTWGDEKLLAETLATVKRQAMTYFLLEELNDVDRPEDLFDLGDYPDPE